MSASGAEVLAVVFLIVFIIFIGVILSKRETARAQKEWEERQARNRASAKTRTVIKPSSVGLSERVRNVGPATRPSARAERDDHGRRDSFTPDPAPLWALDDSDSGHSCRHTTHSNHSHDHSSSHSHDYGSSHSSHDHGSHDHGSSGGCGSSFD